MIYCFRHCLLYQRNVCILKYGFISLDFNCSRGENNSRHNTINLHRLWVTSFFYFFSSMAIHLIDVQNYKVLLSRAGSFNCEKGFFCGAKLPENTTSEQSDLQILEILEQLRKNGLHASRPDLSQIFFKTFAHFEKHFHSNILHWSGKEKKSYSTVFS